MICEKKKTNLLRREKNARKKIFFFFLTQFLAPAAIIQYDCSEGSGASTPLTNFARNEVFQVDRRSCNKLKVNFFLLHGRL